MSPRVVIGLPLHDEQAYLAQALESLLGQSFADLAIAIVDDCSSDASPQMAAEYARRDARISIERPAARLGLTAAWREAYRAAIERHPGAQYFAWASGHDVWHPGWLSALVAAMDARPQLALAYPLSVAVSGSGEVIRLPWEFDTRGIHSSAARLREAVSGMMAGDMVYGLMRVRDLPRAGVFRDVLWPDRLLLAELTRLGEFEQVPELLWYRRFNAPASARKQRSASFPRGAPLHAHLPWWLEHAAVLAAPRRSGRRDAAPGPGAAFAARYLALSAPRELLRRALRLRNRAGARFVSSVPAGRWALGRAEAAARAAGREVKLLPSASVDFDAVAMVNRRPAREQRRAADR